MPSYILPGKQNVFLQWCVTILGGEGMYTCIICFTSIRIETDIDRRKRLTVEPNLQKTSYKLEPDF
jgi:hypothetical protein